MQASNRNKGVLWIAGSLCIFAVLATAGPAGAGSLPRAAQVFTTHYIDPTSDTFGVSPLHDVTDMLLTNNGITLTVRVEFKGPIDYPNSGSANEVRGFLDFDTDQDASTGIASHASTYPSCSDCSTLGTDYYIDLSSYDS